MAYNQHSAAKQESEPTWSSTTKSLHVGWLGAVAVLDRVAEVPPWHKQQQANIMLAFIPHWMPLCPLWGLVGVTPFQSSALGTAALSVPSWIGIWIANFALRCIWFPVPYSQPRHLHAPSQRPLPTVLRKPQEVQKVRDAKAQHSSITLHSLWTTKSTVHQPSQPVALHKV